MWLDDCRSEVRSSNLCVRPPQAANDSALNPANPALVRIDSLCGSGHLNKYDLSSTITRHINTTSISNQSICSYQFTSHHPFHTTFVHDKHTLANPILEAAHCTWLPLRNRVSPVRTLRESTLHQRPEREQTDQPHLDPPPLPSTSSLICSTVVSRCFLYHLLATTGQLLGRSNCNDAGGPLRDPRRRRR